MSDLHHRAAIALALRTVSPGMAALHTAHVARQSPILALPLACTSCGHAPVRTRSRRKKLERACVTCGFVEVVPLEKFGAKPFESVRRRRRGARESQEASAPTTPIPEPADSQLPAATPVPAPASALPSSKRPKKKSALRELLVRNRERQMRQQRRTTDDLTSFLYK